MTGGDGLVAGVDYDVSCCPVCGGSTPPAEHAECDDFLGEWFPLLEDDE